MIPEQMRSGGSLRQLSSKKTVEFESKLLPDDESFQFSTPPTPTRALLFAVVSRVREKEKLCNPISSSFSPTPRWTTAANS